MTFYRPRVLAATSLPQQRQQQQAPQGDTRGSVAMTQVPEQPANPLATASNMVGTYETGKDAIGAYKDASALYDHFFMPSGVNPESLLAGSGTEAVPGATNFLSGGAPAAFPQGAAGGSGTATFLGGEGAGGGSLLSSSATATPWLDAGVAGAADGAGLMSGAAGTEAAIAGTEGASLLGGTAAAGEGAAALGATTAAAEGAGMGASLLGGGAMAAEGAALAGSGAAAAGAGAAAGGAAAATPALAALGPVGIAAGLGLLATKLFGVW